MSESEKYELEASEWRNLYFEATDSLVKARAELVSERNRIYGLLEEKESAISWKRRAATLRELVTNIHRIVRCDGELLKSIGEELFERLEAEADQEPF